MDKIVYHFGGGTADGDGSMKALLGGKGANLAEMARIGLPVPPGFTITTEVCTYYYENGLTYPAELDGLVREGIAKMEGHVGRKFGDTTAMPLLVSVRSGARESMPGMMDTILNLGLNDDTVEAMAAATGNPRFAWDCYRRFVQMYGDVVMGVQKDEGEDLEPFESVIHALKHERYGKDISDSELTADDSRELVKRFKTLVLARSGQNFPADPWEQLKGAIGAVFGSWNNERAITYRQKYGIPSEWGTAVNVQSMVFGNTSDESGSGVAFTRNPAIGVNEFYGEFLMNAQGEDVVAGVRTPDPVAKLAEVMPSAYQELCEIRKTLENHFRDMQDFEFTIQDRKVYMLQTRNGKRTGIAAFRIACDMEKEGLIDWQTAVKRIPADQVDQVLAPVFDASAIKKVRPIAKGLNAGPGAASGRIYLNANRCIEATKKGEHVLLVRLETSPEDLRGMIAAEGILTARGGLSSHAALVARQMGKVCVCGVSELEIDYQKRTVTIAGVTYQEGDYLSLDGTAGLVYAGKIDTAPSEIIQVLIKKTMTPEQSQSYRDFACVMEWCQKATRLQVRTNADSPEQAEAAIAFGASGIGLCRTEHMFFGGNRIDYMRRMILSERLNERKEAVERLLPFQKGDFKGIFKALAGRPATIRLLDPPLHEFLPHTKEQQLAIAQKFNMPVELIMRRVQELHEFNPMLGHRGCRLGISYPEITEMQARAIIEAAIEVQEEEGFEVKPEIMVPLVSFKRELDLQKEVIDRVAEQVFAEKGKRVSYKVGTMIEIPRACVTADEIAQTAEFFSFGTNDLTQTGLGMSRDDSGSFLNNYRDLEIVQANVFASIDQTGVGRLMKMAVEYGRSSRPGIKLGICGEHGGDPASVRFCHKLGLTYVSCSPYRVPTARLAAAQAALSEN
ncbi:MAG: pyruvate, phosphate dikinase [Akkermansia sp.]|nr:pyruvate, phosphate dikinase [Akkermansia sp.]